MLGFVESSRHVVVLIRANEIWITLRPVSKLDDQAVFFPPQVCDLLADADLYAAIVRFANPVPRRLQPVIQGLPLVPVGLDTLGDDAAPKSEGIATAPCLGKNRIGSIRIFGENPIHEVVVVNVGKGQLRPRLGGSISGVHVFAGNLLWLGPDSHLGRLDLGCNLRSLDRIQLRLVDTPLPCVSNDLNSCTAKGTHYQSLQPPPAGQLVKLFELLGPDLPSHDRLPHVFKLWQVHDRRKVLKTFFRDLFEALGTRLNAVPLRNPEESLRSASRTRLLGRLGTLGQSLGDLLLTSPLGENHRQLHPNSHAPDGLKGGKCCQRSCNAAVIFNLGILCDGLGVLTHDPTHGLGEQCRDRGRGSRTARGNRGRTENDAASHSTDITGSKEQSLVIEDRRVSLLPLNL